MSDNRQHKPIRQAGLPTQLSLPIQLSLVAAALFLVSLAVGAFALPLGDVVAGLFGAADQSANIIVQEIRLPRSHLAVMIGATLGLAGASLQGLVQNPLASPSILGAPSAAALFSVAALALGLIGTTSTALPFAGIAGAVASVGLLLLVAGPRTSLTMLILAGLAVGALAASGTALVLILAPARFAEADIGFWLFGSLENRSIEQIGIVMPFVAVSWVLLAWDRTAFRALALGEEAAQSLGLDMRAVRLRVVAGVAIGVGAAVAVAGSIGFIGLVAPQMMRAFVGHDPSRLLLPAALAGAILLLAADIIVRLVPSAEEIKVGIVTALIGGPFLIAMIMRQRALGGAPM